MTDEDDESEDSTWTLIIRETTIEEDMTIFCRDIMKKTLMKIKKL